MDAADLFRKTVFSGDAAALRQLLRDHPETRAHVNDSLFYFDTPAIVHASAQGWREMVDVLLEAGADINAKSTWWAGGFGVLDHDRHDMVPFLRERGARLDAYAAAKHGLIDELRSLLDNDPAAANMRGGDGQTPLHVAHSVEIATLLLDRGAELDARDVDHESTPGQYLVQSPEIVRLLIARGCRTDVLMAAAIGDAELLRRHLDADPESIRTRVEPRWFPMQNPRAGGSIYIWTIGKHFSVHQTARRFGHEALLRLLNERTPPEVRLGEACFAGDAAWVRDQIARDPEQVRKWAQADSARISAAADLNRTETVRLMLECGWPLVGDGRHSPLHWAAWNGNLEMVREILRHSPPLELRDAEHHATPLGWAMYGAEHNACKSSDFPGVIRALRDAGAQPPN